jgi:hypothetical protein
LKGRQDRHERSAEKYEREDNQDVKQEEHQKMLPKVYCRSNRQVGHDFVPDSIASPGGFILAGLFYLYYFFTSSILY